MTLAVPKASTHKGTTCSGAIDAFEVFTLANHYNLRWFQIAKCG